MSRNGRWKTHYWTGALEDCTRPQIMRVKLCFVEDENTHDSAKELESLNTEHGLGCALRQVDLLKISRRTHNACETATLRVDCGLVTRHTQDLNDEGDPPMA